LRGIGRKQGLRGDAVTRGLRLENEFPAAWEVAGDTVAHEFVAEDAVAFGHAEGHAHEIGESAEL